MPKTRHLINLSSKVSPVNNTPNEKRASEISQAQEEDVSLEWFTSSKLKDLVVRIEAIASRSEGLRK